MADTYEEARDALTGFIQAAWNASATAGGASAPLFYDNADGQRPDPPAPFGRVTVRFFSGTRASLGPNARFRRVGRVFVQVFNPAGEGMEDLDRTGQDLVAALEGAGAIDNIWFRDIAERDVGTDGTYYQVNVEADFTFDRVG